MSYIKSYENAETWPIKGYNAPHICEESSGGAISEHHSNICLKRAGIGHMLCTYRESSGAIPTNRPAQLLYSCPPREISKMGPPQTYPTQSLHLVSPHSHPHPRNSRSRP